MALFKLKGISSDPHLAELELAKPAKLALEKHLENWLEKNPWALAEEPLLIIGRQTSANVDIGMVFPDLLALDSEGNLVIIELKKGQAPREVVAQILEYAAWSNELSEDDIVAIAANYLGFASDQAELLLNDRFLETFEVEARPKLKSRIRLFIAAESIPPSVSRVSRFLRIQHSIDISCIAFSVFETGSKEILVTTETLVGHEETNSLKTSSSKWSRDKPVRQVVWEAVQEFVANDPCRTFAPKDIAEVILKRYPNFNRSTINCQITSDCVNHPSRSHYPGGEDRYWRIAKGSFRLVQSTDILDPNSEPSPL
jgi:hypothetical protein